MPRRCDKFWAFGTRRSQCVALAAIDKCAVYLQQHELWIWQSKVCPSGESIKWLIICAERLQCPFRVVYGILYPGSGPAATINMRPAIVINSLAARRIVIVELEPLAARATEHVRVISRSHAF